jgi:M6 family metalloprotease-like protein
MKHARTYFICMLGILIFSQPAQALIVWNGKIVPAWPKEAQHAAFGKKSVSSPTAPFGFFPRRLGTMYGAVMIVDFSDQTAKFTKEQVWDWLNKTDYSSSYANGSVHDYFYQVSNGKFDLQNEVFGYYRAKNPKSYYESSSGYDKADELVNEMMAFFDPTVDFSKYDNDKNGTTESISFVYAGSGKTWGQGLWPHSGWIGQKKDGVTLGSYNMCDMGPGLGLYVFCHETGHMIFGWPDLYWFGDYCIMGNRMSDVNPVAINDFFRADQGWIPTTTVTSADNAIFTATPNQMAYGCINPTNKKQMYVWSNIKNTGRYSTLRGKGLLLFKYDDGIDGNTSATSRQLYVVEADGNNAMAGAQWPSPGSAATDFFYSANKTDFSSATTPAAAWGLKIYNISAISDTMRFYLGTGTVPVRNETVYAIKTPLTALQGPLSVFNPAGQRVGVLNSITSARMQPATHFACSGFYITKSQTPVYSSNIRPQHLACPGHEHQLR